MMEMNVDEKESRLKFKRTFMLYIQMCFLLPTTINKISSVHMPPILHVDTIREQNWSGHVLNFLIKRIREHTLEKKYAVNGNLFALMIVYFHEFTHKNKSVHTIPGPPWVQRWTGKLLVERIQVEIKNDMVTQQNFFFNFGVYLF
ncbi:uncharacterized protein DS421_4g120040 [Arachis hypogaea]|nr:uncharacterized protein DS421_4g120040 [Arachis hypogaea]